VWSQQHLRFWLWISNLFRGAELKLGIVDKVQLW